MLKSRLSFFFMCGFQDCLQRTTRSSRNTIGTAFGSSGPLLKLDEGTGNKHGSLIKGFFLAACLLS